MSEEISKGGLPVKKLLAIFNRKILNLNESLNCESAMQKFQKNKVHIAAV